MPTRRGLVENPEAAMITVLSLVLAIPFISAEAPAPPFALRIHYVGGTAGWFFNTSTNTTSAKYSDWAASETFYVSDFLRFSERTYCSIVQTNNETMYSLCDENLYDDNDKTIHWSNEMSTNISSTPEDYDIPITYEGPNYFFSSDMDGEQCRMGMKFKINVLHGKPPPSAYGAPPPPRPGGGGGKDKNNGVELIQSGMVWAGLGIFSLVFMAA